MSQRPGHQALSGDLAYERQTKEIEPAVPAMRPQLFSQQQRRHEQDRA